MSIVERKRRLDGSSEDYHCDVLLLDAGKRAVLRYRWSEPLEIRGTSLTVPRGGLTISHYWVDRHYNAYHFVGPPEEGARTLAYYFNVVGDTVIREDLVSYDDLTIDVFIDPAGTVLVLDEEDLPPDLPSRERGIVNRALEELTTNARRLSAEIERASRAYLPREG